MVINYQDLTWDTYLGQSNTIELPFDDTECEYTLTVWLEDGVSRIDEAFPDSGFTWFTGITDPTFIQQDGSSDERIVDVASYASITYDFTDETERVGDGSLTSILKVRLCHIWAVDSTECLAEEDC